MKQSWSDGNRVELLINGEQYYPRVFEAMAQAREEILLETFII
ncbi:cardiolipin synthase B, partial [Pseudomonas sp. BW16M2]|nr:cardiolipin synthase B [Pseudomonas sp. BW16M2]